MSAEGVDLDSAISSIRRFIPAVVSETCLFGIYTLLIIQSTYILLTLIMPAVIPQISGIYPTIIIVLVCLQKTHCDRQFTYTDGPTLGAQPGHPTQILSTFEAYRPTVRATEPIVIIGRTPTTTAGSDSQSGLNFGVKSSEV
ncbi:hypothetical protein OF83DRAFT_1173926 [Amylostereum chailletii]|nr:hypothetical protein OF83DRAFT_1173926 [Amylostereum chailletii]